MGLEVTIEQVAAEPMAAVAARTAPDDLAVAIRTGLDKVYAVLRAGDYGPLGCNAVYYAPGGPPFDVRIGVRLTAPFSAVGEVIAAKTPAGEVAHAVYFGEYWKMRPAHEAAKAFAAENGRRITGASWEVYGDWSDDWSKVRTDIYYLLQEKAGG
jgi:effector-binding domain-containing protein